MDRLQQGILLSRLEKAEANIKTYKRDLRVYRLRGDKEMIEFAKNQLRFWKFTAKKVGAEYDKLMNGSAE